MKRITFALLIGLLMVNEAGSAQQTSSPQASAATPYSIVSRDANSRVWENVSYQTSPSGQMVPLVHRYAELATGLCYQQNGQWLDSIEQINILPDGTAAATNGQHKVFFPADVYNGTIRMLTPDGKLLESQPLALSYDDGTNLVLIAVLTNSIGELISSNQIVYPNAFVGIDADLLYTYTKAGFEQDVIIRAQPPSPESFSMDSHNTKLQLMTEFIDPPQPSVTTRKLPVQQGMALDNDQLSFGMTEMRTGRAFFVGANRDKVHTLVAKKWITVSGRQILVEEVPIMTLAQGLLKLPPSASVQTLRRQGRQIAKIRSSTAVMNIVSAKRLLPVRRPMTTGIERILTLKSPKSPFSNGLVLDYQTLNGSVSDFTFQADTTYYISGLFSISDTVTFEGGTVIKYEKGVSASIESINFIDESDLYRPAIFTAQDDDSVGEKISGSTGAPSGYYGDPAIYIDNENDNFPGLNYVRISYAATAIYEPGDGAAYYFSNSQFINCGSVFYMDNGGAQNVFVFNALMSGIGTSVFNGYSEEDPAADSVTFVNCNLLVNDDSGFYGPTLRCYDCICANELTISADGYSTADGDYNGFYRSSGFGGDAYGELHWPFQTNYAGYFYLTTNSAFRGIGNNESLTIGLTTYPPVIYTNVTTTSNLWLDSQVPRDQAPGPSGGHIDLGYHYPPIDYVLDNLTVSNALLTITNGIVVASGNEPGIQLKAGASIASIGTPTSPNWFVRYQSVQEEPIFIGTTNNSLWRNISATNGGAANAVFEFSKFAVPAGGGYEFYDSGNSLFTNLVIQASEFYGGSNDFSGSAATSSTFLDNNLFQRSALYASNNFTSASLSISNNLFWGTSVTISQPSGGLWTAYNNEFDSDTITNSILTNSYNAYLNCIGYLIPTNTTDIYSNSSLAYEAGPFGDFYQPTDSPLLGKGNTNANLVGLYPYTTQTSEIPNGTNIVDIGYHYVATGTNGLPLDSNNDGIPDYLQNANGIEVGDPWENGTNPYNSITFTNGISIYIFEPKPTSQVP